MMRILIVEDEAGISRFLERAMRSEGFATERAADGAVVASLAVGVGLFVGASAFAYWRISRRVLVGRLAILAVTVGGVALTAQADPIWPLGVVAAVLGYMTRAEIQRTGVGKESENLALGGLITGAIAIVIGIANMSLGFLNVFSN